MILLYFFLCIAVLWVTGFFMINDFSVKSVTKKELNSIKKILVVFPHPDDEVHSCAGLIKKFSGRAKITLLILTKGERGNEGAKLDLNLKRIREREAKKSARVLGISKLIHKDLGDGMLTKKKKQITMAIENTIKNTNPDLVITYDLSGLYGHEDHIAVSEVVTRLTKGKTKLWYTTLPESLLRNIKLPDHMAKSPQFKKKRSLPNIKLFTGFNIFPRIMALYSYKSQLFAFKKSYPKVMPMWFLVSMRMYEYFYEV